MTWADHLIVTADDFGMARAVNEAVEIAHSDGILTAASLMVAGTAAADAVERASRMPRLRVGLHLVLVDGEPMLPASRIPDLVGRDGRFRTDMVALAFAIAARPAVRRQLAAEIEAQFEAFHATGLPLDHVNAHKHFHLHPIIAATAVEVGARFGLRAMRVPLEPSRVLKGLGEDTGSFSIEVAWARVLRHRAERAGLCTPDAVFGLRWSGAMTLNRLAGLLRQRPRGIVEIYTHPATNNDFPGHASGYRCAEELAALCDPSCRALAGAAASVGGYADRPDISRGRAQAASPFTTRRARLT